MPDAIASPHNPHVRLLRSLAEKRREREERGLAVLEGLRLAEEAAAARLAVPFFLYTAEFAADARGKAVVEALAAGGARPLLATPVALARAASTETPQGIVAAFRIPQASLENLPTGLVLCCDGLQDPGNLGTLARTAAALGAVGLVCTDGTTDPWSPKAVRAAMGATFRLPVVQAAAGPALAHLAGRGFQVVLAEATGDQLPWEVNWRQPTVLVVGSEAAGPSAAARAAATATVRIPMPGWAESLNAAVAGALLLYEALRQRTAL